MEDSDFNNPYVWHDCRLTFSSQDKNLTCLEDKEFRNNCKRVARNFIQDCLTLGYFSKYTGGIEEHNRKGETCKMHLHLRFESKVVTGSMRKTMKKKLEEIYHQDTTGNSNFMFKAVIVRNVEEFERYPLKQNLHKYLCGGYTDERLQYLHDIAKGCFLKTVECNQSKENAIDDAKCLYEKVFKKCQDCKNQYQIAEKFLDYYVDNNKPVNSQTIKGYTITAALQLQLLSKKNYLQSLGFLENTES